MANPGPGGGFRAGPISDRKQGAMRRRRKQGMFPGRPGQFPGRGPGAVKNPNYGGGVPPRTAPTPEQMTGGYDSILDPREWKGQLPGRPPGGDIRYPPGIDRTIKGLNYGGEVPPSGGGGAGGGGGQRQQGPRFGRRWNNLMQNEGGFNPSTDLSGFRQAAKQAYKGGADWGDIRAGLVSPIAQQIFAYNAAGGQNKPSPYIDFFRSNPNALAQLGQFARGKEYMPTAYENGVNTGTQAQLFEQFPGLRESYLSSLGRTEVSHPGGGTYITGGMSPVDRYKRDNGMLPSDGGTAPPPSGGGVSGSYGMARGTTQPAASMTDLLSGYFGNQTPGLWNQNSMMPRRRF